MRYAHDGAAPMIRKSQMPHRVPVQGSDCRWADDSMSPSRRPDRLPGASARERLLT